MSISGSRRLAEVANYLLPFFPFLAIFLPFAAPFFLAVHLWALAFFFDYFFDDLASAITVG